MSFFLSVQSRVADPNVGVWSDPEPNLDKGRMQMWIRVLCRRSESGLNIKIQSKQSIIPQIYRKLIKTILIIVLIIDHVVSIHLSQIIIISLYLLNDICKYMLSTC